MVKTVKNGIKRVRGWTSGQRLPAYNFVEHPPPPRSNVLHCTLVLHERYISYIQWKLAITNLYEVLGITNDFLYPPIIVKYMKKNLDITKPCYSKNKSLDPPLH